MALTPCSDLSAAGWLMASDRPWQLIGFGPPDFPAYARLRFLPDPTYEGQSENDVDRGEDAPLETVQLRTALQTLTRHTCTPDDCYFCLWDGWGLDIDGDDGTRIFDPQRGTIRQGPDRAMPVRYRDVGPAAEPARPDDRAGQWRPTIAPAFPPSVRHGPKVVIPHRAYFLFHGQLSDVGDWGAAQMWPGQPRLHMPDPAFIWPADHAWCVANDVDPHWAGIGAGRAAIDELLADPRLDVVPADPRQDQPRYR